MALAGVATLLCAKRTGILPAGFTRRGFMAIAERPCLKVLQMRDGRLLGAPRVENLMVAIRLDRLDGVGATTRHNSVSCHWT